MGLAPDSRSRSLATSTRPAAAAGEAAPAADALTPATLKTKVQREAEREREREHARTATAPRPCLSLPRSTSSSSSIPFFLIPQLKVASLETAVADALAVIDLPAARSRLAALETSASAEDLWSDRAAAERLLRSVDAARSVVTEAERLAALLDDAAAAAELAGDATEAAEAEAFVQEGAGYAAALEAALAAWELRALLGGEWDGGDAVLTVQSGAGGTEAQDWAAMLERMYTRWAASQGFTLRVLDRAPGEEAGIKSVELEVGGRHAYGLLAAERGTHRLVRLSPFNAKAARQTSFASVEVMPVIGASEWRPWREGRKEGEKQERMGWGGPAPRLRFAVPNLNHLNLTLSLSPVPLPHLSPPTQPTTWSPPSKSRTTTSRSRPCGPAARAART